MSSLESWKKLSRQDCKWVREVRLDRELVSLEEALDRAEQSGLDCVLVSKSPFVVKLMDLQKYIYDQKKKQKEIEKKNRANIQKVKEVKFHVGIDEADFKHKLKQMQEFIEDGDKVEVKVILRGREMKMSQQFIEDFVKKLTESVQQIGKVIKPLVKAGNMYAGAIVRKE